MSEELCRVAFDYDNNFHDRDQIGKFEPGWVEDEYEHPPIIIEEMVDDSGISR
jgi:hypothetical protein